MVRNRPLRRRVAGWAMTYPLRTQRVLGALGQRRPKGFVHRFGKGPSYTSLALARSAIGQGKMCGRTSTGSAGDGFDNAMTESLFVALECELIDRRVQGDLSSSRASITQRRTFRSRLPQLYRPVLDETVRPPAITHLRAGCDNYNLSAATG